MESAKDLITKIAKKSYFSDTEIARRVNSTQPTIWRIRNNETENCGSQLYLALVALAKEVTDPNFKTDAASLNISSE